ncbi:type VI secretion system amidase effector protein Tae4 [Chryseobacterium sp. GMJ5]|uniref:Type VI secretion system amidase effector protein Tae4 n=1 Tax=Chryseobacterium gilvum TaxID=2976534 RepID=A0ABT2W0Y3_9FLAO|nr:type VI secretion system amidase effector protein Tae4 [Chryseobacterium gilvum]MCU7614375.1 type VI secretion system amidase effector protein Tae4 [Chryseobacterium gilvum]
MMRKINSLMLIALALFLWSCRTEVETESLSNSHTRNKNSSKIQFQQFQKETNIKDFKNFLDIASEKKKNAANKNTDLLLAFKIDTENINRLTFNDCQTYTFRAYNIFESPENIYNVLYYKGKTKWEFGLFKIVRNSQNKTEKIIPIYDSSVGELSVAENSVLGKTSCMMDVYFTEFHCTCPPSWGSCDLCSECVSESHSYVFTDCGGDGAGNPIFNSGSSGLPIIYPGTVHDTNNPPAYTPIPQNPSPYYFDPNIPPTIDDGYVRAVRSDNFWSQLDANAKNWAQYNPGMYNALLENYLNKYTIPNNSNNLQFHNWAISFLNENPDAWEQFENWYLMPSEGKDGDYDAAYWDNPNLTFPPQNLPNWTNFEAAYPKHKNSPYDTPDKMYSSVGGMPYSIYLSSGNENTCALRISKALNYSGVTIPNIPNKTFKGNDNKYYFLSAKNLLAWMKKTFGTPSGNNYLTGSQGGTNGQNFPTLLANIKGIYIMIPNVSGGCETATTPATGFCASGHADMISGGMCDGGCYFGATGGVKEIFVWNLP